MLNGKIKVIGAEVLSVKPAKEVRLGRKLKVMRDDGKVKSYTSTYWQGGWAIIEKPKRGSRVEIVYRNGKVSYIKPA